MNNLCFQKCFELGSDSQYNVKLSIITSLEQRESMLRMLNDVRSVTLIYPHRASCKIFLTTAGVELSMTYDLWNTISMLCQLQLSYA